MAAGRKDGGNIVCCLCQLSRESVGTGKERENREGGQKRMDLLDAGGD